jgi:hypothetical protein
VVEVKHLRAVDGCPNCGSLDWLEGPSGGASINVKCGNCGLWFNNSPFGLDFIGIKKHCGENKILRWYCPKCSILKDEAAFISPNRVGYDNYPTCAFCGGLMKVCWSYEKFPRELCDSCDYRFKCYTERGNF